MNLYSRHEIGMRYGAAGLALVFLAATSNATAAEPDEAAKLSAQSIAESESHSEDHSFHLGGYARTWASFNLQNPPETSRNDRYSPSMLRGSLLLDADAKTGPVTWKIVGAQMGNTRQGT